MRVIDSKESPFKSITCRQVAQIGSDEVQEHLSEQCLVSRMFASIVVVCESYRQYPRTKK